MAVSKKLELISGYAVEKGFVKPNRPVFVIKPEDLRRLFEELVNKYGYEGLYLSTIIGTDMQSEGKIRLDYYVVLLPEEQTIVIRTYVDKQKPVIESIVDILPGALSGECETHDLLGVIFKGNPFIKRSFFVPKDLADRGIHPLRKESGV